MNNQTEVRRAKFGVWMRSHHWLSEISHSFDEEDGEYFSSEVQVAWEAYSAALDSVVVELPSPESMKFCPSTSGDYDAGFDHGQTQARADFIEAIHAAGIKTK